MTKYKILLGFVWDSYAFNTDEPWPIDFRIHGGIIVPDGQDIELEEKGDIIREITIWRVPKTEMALFKAVFNMNTVPGKKLIPVWKEKQGPFKETDV